MSYPEVKPKIDEVKIKRLKNRMQNISIFQSFHIIMLSLADSNHYKQNQNLLCYHYTKGQSLLECKVSVFLFHYQIFANFFHGEL